MTRPVLPSDPMTVLSDAPARETTASASPNASTAPRHGDRGRRGAGRRARRPSSGRAPTCGSTRRSRSTSPACRSVSSTHALRHDGAPPLYYALLHVWTAVFGSGDWAVRSLSGVCMIGAAVALWFVGRRVAGHGRRVDRGDARRRESVRDPVRDRDAHVRARDPARVVGHPGVPARARVADARPARAVRRDRRAAALHAVLDALPRCSSSACCSSGSRGAGSYRDAARRMLLAMVVAGLAFLPWLPTFLYPARAHRHAVGDRAVPGHPVRLHVARLLRRRRAGGLGPARPRDRAARSSDCSGARPTTGASSSTCTRSPARGGRRSSAARRSWSGSRSTTSPAARSSRATARSCSRSSSWSSRAASRRSPIHGCARACSWSCSGSASSAAAATSRTNRTQAGEVAAVLRADAAPGDVVVYCPDQLGPAVHRLAPPGLDEVTYPDVRLADVRRLGRLQGAARARRSRGVRPRGARARRRPHALVRDARPATSRIRSCARRSRRCSPRRGRATSAVAPDERIFEHPGSAGVPGARTGERLIAVPARSQCCARSTTDVRVRAVVVPFVLSRVHRVALARR